MYWLHAVFSLLLATSSRMSNFVAARFCEGGHICSLPRECCTQGCCPPYQTGPRQLPPPSEHVLNLFFISHWFFWCVVVAIILAILCAYSLWKKRRTLCGWGLAEHHTQSEGDSAGSCYAPPHYSRCSSFHHPPPPYTEVTSKPDLYPLVFTCNSDNGKNGSSYLMVQYFRNYIVRPVGSLSAASTVDSLSSSFICNVNEANTLVPPPYSRAASPDIGFTTHLQQQYSMMPRSASQLVCPNGGACGGGAALQELSEQQAYHSPQPRTSHYAAVTLNSAEGGTGNTTVLATAYNPHMRTSESGSFHHSNDESGGESSRSGSASGCNSGVRDQRTATFIQSHSDQHFRYIANSNSSISDIFMSNSCAAGLGGGAGGGDGDAANGVTGTTVVNAMPASTSPLSAHTQSSVTPVIYSNVHPLHRASTNPASFVDSHPSPVYNSCNSIGGISITVPVSADGNETELRDLHMLRHSLETCCQLLQKQQHQQITSGGYVSGDSPLRMHELAKKYVDEAGLRSYVTSGTCSGVSSLANVGTPSSPPQATSPTGEVKEILDQIRQLQAGVSYEDLMHLHTRPTLHHTVSSPSPTHTKLLHSSVTHNQLQRFATMPEEQLQTTTSTAVARTAEHPSRSPLTPNSNSHSSYAVAAQRSSSFSNKPTGSSKRPSTLQQSSKRKFYSPKPNKAMYIPMMSNPSPSSNRCILKSPVSSVVGASFFTSRSRMRKGWISRSAPTTPGTALPPGCLGDDSPLLNEHEEDPEGEQIAELD